MQPSEGFFEVQVSLAINRFQ